jgi:hypothetical protein
MIGTSIDGVEKFRGKTFQPVPNLVDLLNESSMPDLIKILIG